jgi:hypothetical protein
MGFQLLYGDEGYSIVQAKSMFRYKMRYSTPQDILIVIGYVLNHMLLGTSDVTFDQSGNWEAFADPNDSRGVDANAVKNAIHRDIIQEGG